jgi:5-methylcytosine-specific restriction enzyme A
LLLSPFNIGKVYKRTTLQDQYGGNRQSGIAASAKFPFIFIFSGKSGHQHGYKDQWENEDVFSYTGEGQLGDMSFVKGNLSLRDHLQTGKRVFLFTEAERSYVKLEAELEFLEFDYFPGTDREGKDRLAIKFFFKRMGVVLPYSKYQTEVETNAEEIDPIYIKLPSITERQGLVTSRVGQGAYRKSILYRWEFKCAVTQFTKNEVLIASHIVPWKESTNEERLDVHNGILLSPTYDALFDKNLITFESNGNIILSPSLLNVDYESIGISGKEKIKNLSHYNHSYLDRHRERTFAK